MSLTDLIRQRIQSGLKRKSVTTCSSWAETYRIMGTPFPGFWTFKHHPWLKEMHDFENERMIGQKSAQMGYTETALNLAFYYIDIRTVDVLYVLPSKTPDASDFSASRFDGALDLSKHLENLFSDVKNVGHKRAGSTNLYVRGSKSRAGLKSIPVGLVILDEVDEFDQDNIPLAMERLSGQVDRKIAMLSTPTIDDRGINRYYNLSSQDHFFFRCPFCSRRTELIFPDCLTITAESINDPGLKNSHLICKECKHQLYHETKSEWLKSGVWISGYEGRDDRGFYINQLYSSTVTPVEIAQKYLEALRDPASEQEFWNSKIGLPHIVEGARVTDSNIDQCKEYSNHKTSDPPQYGCITMGVDVGKVLHCEIDQWILPHTYIGSVDLNVQAKCRVLTMFKVKDFEELDEYMRKYRVLACVIDSQPEHRKAYEFASRFWGHVKLCIYGKGISGKQIVVGRDDHGQIVDEHLITVDRTSWLDLSLSRFRTKGMLTLPIDTTEEYREHIKSLVRVYSRDVDGNPIGKYEKGEQKPDHYAHARNYAELALPFATSLNKVQDIRGVV